MWVPSAEWTFCAEPVLGGSFEAGGTVDFVCKHARFGSLAWICLSNGKVDYTATEDHSEDDARGYDPHRGRWDMLFGMNRLCPKYAFIDENEALIARMLCEFVTYCHKAGPRRAAYAWLGLRRYLPLPKDVLKLVGGLVLDSWTDKAAWAKSTDAWVESFIKREWSTRRLEMWRTYKKQKV
jgi:hypothetical protein